ncbi:MAG: TadE/TadG family type IV pilus assembly protein [Acidimicrobiales bacterium]
MRLSRRSRGDRGAVLVESAIVLPFLFLFMFGIMEVGGALKSYSGASNAVRAGGRMASVAGSDAMADQQILVRMAREAAGLGKGELEYVIIWNADGVGDSPPGNCIAAAGAALSPNLTSVGVSDGGTSQKGACNVYIRPEAPGGAFQMARDELANPPEYYFGCSGASDPQAGQKVDCRWSPRNRKVQISPRGTPADQRLTPDYVGVHIRASHEYYTGILGDTLTITESGINLIEPDNFGLDTP